jgi:hypothetical protein
MESRNIFLLLVLICQRLSKPQGLVRLELLGESKKNPFTSSGLEPTKLRFVA